MFRVPTVLQWVLLAVPLTRCGLAAAVSLKSEKKYRDLKILINRAPEYLAATTFTTVLILHVSDTGNNAEESMRLKRHAYIDLSRKRAQGGTEEVPIARGVLAT